MLSYQHDYHAGNHADLLKHIALSIILEGLCKKEKPFTVIDTHAGSAVYDLNGEMAEKTGEAKDGIQRLDRLAQRSIFPFPDDIKSFYEREKPYLEQGLYAGSVEIERSFLRKGDTLFAVEKHPKALEALRSNVALPLHSAEGMKKASGTVRVRGEDSFEALRSLVPPLVKRGLVLCDPSFEDAQDYKAVTDALSDVRRKWNTAIIALWYPLITRRRNETSQMLCALEDAAKIGTVPVPYMKTELIVRNEEEMQEEDGSHLYGSGIFVINPPWQLEERLSKARDFLQKVLDKDFM